MQGLRIIHMKTSADAPKTLCGRPKLGTLAVGTPLADGFRHCRRCVRATPKGWVLPVIMRDNEGRFMGQGATTAAGAYTIRLVWQMSGGEGGGADGNG